MKLQTIARYLFLLNAVMGAVLLFLPIVWMEIGPLGIAYYGPQVPDIWVYGGALTGKDLSFAPLMIMLLFQLGFIVIGIVLSLVCFFSWEKRKKVIWLGVIILFILAMFPDWIDDYVNVIIGNSDGAAKDLTVRWTYGWYLFCCIAITSSLAFLLTIVTIFRKRKPKLLPA